MRIKEGLEQEYADYVKINSNDGYSKGVVDYGERWADTMDLAIAAGSWARSGPRLTRFFVDNAERLSREADTEGITGFMYGCAVSALAKFWIYGEELRRWHNLKTHIGNEGERANESGGTLNPALLNIEV